MSHYDVFISSSSNDFSIAGEIYNFLCNNKLSVFFSEQSLPRHGNADYRDVIDKAIELTTHMVVVTSSRENVEGEWVKAEWGSFINERRSGRKNGNIVTILVGNLSPADLPMSLRQYEILPYNEVGLSKLIPYVAAGAAPVVTPVLQGETSKKASGKLAGYAAGISLFIAVLAFVGWSTFLKPVKTEPPRLISSSPENQPHQPPVSTAKKHLPTTEDLGTKSTTAQEQAKQGIEERRQDSTTASTIPPAPVQPIVAPTVTSPTATTVVDSSYHDKQTLAAKPSPSGQDGWKIVVKEQAASSIPSVSAAGQSAPSASASTAKTKATVFINHPGINDQFVEKLLSQLHAGLSKQEKEAATSSAAKYILRWGEKPKLWRDGPNDNGEFTYSISLLGEIYNPANAQVVKSIPVRDSQTGKIDQATIILNDLITKSSSRILNSLAALEQ